MSTVQAKTLQVYNLDDRVTDDHLYELFLQAGPLECVKVIKRPRGTAIGFIVFKHECSVNYAKNIFEGTELFKQELIFDETAFHEIESQRQRLQQNQQRQRQQQQQQQHHNQQQNQRFQNQQRHNQSVGTHGQYNHGQQNYLHNRTY